MEGELLAYPLKFMMRSDNHGDQIRNSAEYGITVKKELVWKFIRMNPKTEIIY
jgi:hypothetical protein